MAHTRPVKLGAGHGEEAVAAEGGGAAGKEAAVRKSDSGNISDWRMLLAPLPPPKPGDGEASHLGTAGTDDEGEKEPLKFLLDHNAPNPTEAILRAPVWIFPALFLLVQWGCFALTGDSFFGFLTGGVVESLRLSTGLPMTWHMATGSVMWALGFVQIILKQLRHGKWAWIHRFSGRLVLLLWFGCCGPTAFWLSLHVGIGKSKAQLTMLVFALTGMDSALWASYYMLRGWIVIRRRVRGQKSVDLHHRLMRVGLVFTMLILFQRPLQFVAICFRGALAALAEALAVVPSVAGTLRWIVAVPMDHNVLLSVTTMYPQVLLLILVDGPRSEAPMNLLAIASNDHDEIVDAFGNAAPNLLEKLFWRSRFFVFLALRYMVTQGFTEDPVEAS